MRKLVYYIAVSLDGCIAGPDGQVGFYPTTDAYTAWMADRFPETIPTRYREPIGLKGTPNKTFDTIIMGFGTYDPGRNDGITSPYAHLEQYVASTSLDKVDDPAVTLVRDPIALVRELKQRDGLDIWLCGGGRLAGSLLPEIDQLVIKSYPVVVGAGAPVFGGKFEPTLFTPTGQVTFEGAAQVTWFDRK